MNPADQELRKTVEMVAGTKCHFYVATSSDFDRALVEVSHILSSAAAGDIPDEEEEGEESPEEEPAADEGEEAPENQDS